MNRFLSKLSSTSQRNNSLICVGLDPIPDLLPINDITKFNKEIIAATSDLVCAYKPQMAFYESMGMPGLRCLEATLAAIPDHIPVILDGKRNDIATTAAAYAKAIFVQWGADATTLNPYLGTDSIEPFLEYEDRVSIILVKTSNPGSEDFQTLPVRVGDGHEPLYKKVAEAANGWNTRGNVGVLVGATYPQELKEVRGMCPDMPILVPGVGAQGGDIEASIQNGVNSSGRGVIINVSRQILYASRSSQFADAARRETESLRENINSVLGSLGHSW